MSKLKARFLSHPVIDTLIHLTGNARACLWTEPLWGIPYNLYTPFVAVYMAALGMSSTQIGLVATISMVTQVVFSLLSGALTDKLGRRLCTLIFDCMSWSIPTFLWMCAQDYTWFVVAAIFNSANRVTENSWNLLMAEEAPPEKLVHMYTITHIAGVISGFIAPLSYFFVQRYSVVPTMRVLYGITFVMMTSKFIILYFLSHETSVGKRRMADTKNVSLSHYLADSPRILKYMLHEPRVMLTVALIACLTALSSTLTNFWPLLLTDALAIPEENLSIFSTLRSLVMLAAYFTIAPRMQAINFRKPMRFALLMMLLVQVMLITMPSGALLLVLIAALIEATATSMLNPLTNVIQMINTEREQRARINGWLYALCLLVTSPFGVIAGVLSDMNRIYPFILNIALVAIALYTNRKLAAICERDGILE